MPREPGNRSRAPRSVLVGWLCGVFLSVASPATEPQDLFSDHELLEIGLHGPLASLIENKEQRVALPFEYLIGGASYPVRLSARGHSRMRVCNFPPLHLQFPDSKKIKIVTHCRPYDASETNVLEEYLAYRIFGLLSDISHKTRLLRIRYSDTEVAEGDAAVAHYAFAIEPIASVAWRAGGTRAKIEAVPRKRLNRQQEALVYVFQYLIGNTDWSLVTADGEDNCCHNGRLIETDSQLYYVPYDFDLAGLVNARYAKPDPSLRLRSVRQRRYRGFCMPDDDLAPALQSVNSKASEIYRIAGDLPKLSDKDRSKLVRYLERFFELAEDEQQLLAMFRRRCL